MKKKNLSRADCHSKYDRFLIFQGFLILPFLKLSEENKKLRSSEMLHIYYIIHKLDIIGEIQIRIYEYFSRRESYTKYLLFLPILSVNMFVKGKLYVWKF